MGNNNHEMTELEPTSSSLTSSARNAISVSDNRYKNGDDTSLRAALSSTTNGPPSGHNSHHHQSHHHSNSSLGLNFNANHSSIAFAALDMHDDPEGRRRDSAASNESDDLEHGPFTPLTASMRAARERVIADFNKMNAHSGLSGHSGLSSLSGNSNHSGHNGHSGKSLGSHHRISSASTSNHTNVSQADSSSLGLIGSTSVLSSSIGLIGEAEETTTLPLTETVDYSNKRVL
jgi:hypothetical protein